MELLRTCVQIEWIGFGRLEVLPRCGGRSWGSGLGPPLVCKGSRPKLTQAGNETHQLSSSCNSRHCEKTFLERTSARLQLSDVEKDGFQSWSQTAEGHCRNESDACKIKSLMLTHTIETLIIANTILGVPYYNYSILYPETLF